MKDYDPGFFDGLVYALPISLVLWGVIVLGVAWVCI